jgi:DNA-binding transcriptional regulator YiaG
LNIEWMMANLAVVLKDEIRRLARKELKSHLGTTRQAVGRYRREIAELKRQLQAQAKKIAQLERRSRQTDNGAVVDDSPQEQIRFSAKSVRSQRRRLGLSAADYGKLIGVSGLTIYNWEQGKTRPRQSQLAALVAARGIGKREALARLAR